jgi:hypothetical protein
MGCWVRALNFILSKESKWMSYTKDIVYWYGMQPALSTIVMYVDQPTFIPSRDEFTQPTTIWYDS